ncbi:hypothetical protein CCP2SC5_1300001 [Azospirillaceae bacterium]
MILPESYFRVHLPTVVTGASDHRDDALVEFTNGHITHIE